MSDESTPCNVEQVNTAFVQAPKAINTIIANKSRVYHAIYRDLIPRDTFTMGEGYMKFSETFHGGRLRLSVEAPVRPVVLCGVLRVQRTVQGKVELRTDLSAVDKPVGVLNDQRVDHVEPVRERQVG